MKTKTKNTTMFLVQAALIAALYITVNYAQEMLIPTSTSAAVQVRVAELLCTLCVFTPAAIPGLTLGCVISNIISVGILPLDIILGSFATLLAALCSYFLRNVKLFKIPMLSLFMPVIFNAVIIGLELEIFYVEGDFEFVGFLTQGGLVGLGEFIICIVVGIPFYLVLRKTPVFRKLN